MADSQPARKPLRVACLGGGYNSAIGRTHITALSMDRRFTVVAGCFSLEAPENAFSAEAYGVDPSRRYTSLEEILKKESGKVDAIVILTPTDQHADQVVKCLEKKIPVISEKALAVDSDEIETIAAKVKQTRGFLAVTYNYLGYPMLRELQAMIAAGDLGNIKQIQIEMPQEGFIRRSEKGDPIVPQEWRLHDHRVPTISLDLGVHVHSMVSFLTGEKPEQAVAMSATMGNFAEIVDNVMGLVRYTGGLQVNYWFSKTALGYRNGLKVRVFGDKAAAEWLQENPEFIAFATNNGKRSTVDRASGGMKVALEPRYTRFKAGHPAGFIEAFANYYWDVADALESHLGIMQHGENKHVHGISMALEGMKLLEAMAQSSRESRWVNI
jgi:predicted dehydrogenase